VRIPVANPDFFPFVQRAKDIDPEAIFVFVPGAQPGAFGKALVDVGVDTKKTKVMGQGKSPTRTRSRSWATPRSA